MNVFIKNPLTIDELQSWNKNNLINPRTLRKIKINKKIYNYIKSEYNKIFNLSILDSIDDKDPVTFTQFWTIHNNNKIIVYPNLDNLILYKDSQNLIRCFEKETISYLKAYNILKHPITLENIPSYILNSIETKDLSEEINNMTLSQKAFIIFQKFNSISIFIDSEWFLQLNKSSLIKFNYELSDFYEHNFTIEQKNKIKIIFKNNIEIQNNTIENIFIYLLTQIDYLLNITEQEYKYMINYILIGALGIVIPKIKKLYPNFLLGF
jgi:hypothetical protein